MSKGMKIGLVAVVVIGAILVYYYFFIGKASEAGAVNSADAAIVKKMRAIADQYLPTGFPDWIMQDANNRLASGDANEAYYINGTLTKAGALLQTFDAEYYTYDYPGDREAMHSALWTLWHTEKAKLM